jgi:hypothetical protein
VHNPTKAPERQNKNDRPLGRRYETETAHNQYRWYLSVQKDGLEDIRIRCNARKDCALVREDESGRRGLHVTHGKLKTRGTVSDNITRGSVIR